MAKRVNDVPGIVFVLFPDLSRRPFPWLVCDYCVWFFGLTGQERKFKHAHAGVCPLCKGDVGAPYQPKEDCK